LRIAITGASGFLGRPLVEKLSILGVEVLAIARSIPNDISKNKIHWLKADLSIPESYHSEVKLFSPEVLIHLAWQDIPDFSIEKSKMNLDQSIDFINFIASLQSCNKILFSGSCWEYDNASGECLETDKVEGSKNHFTWAKNSLRKEAELLCSKKSISFAWFRIFYIYGPGQRSGSLLPTIFNNLKEGKLPKINSPFNSNDYIFIDDVVDAFTIASTSSFSSGIYNLGSGISTNAIQICRYAEKLVLSSSNLSNKLHSKSSPKLSDEDFWAEMTLTTKSLIWKPKTNLIRGIKLTWDSLN
jgi:nucleoside-diphosphate-sugar epimerase